jgi:hypothetical protein
MLNPGQKKALDAAWKKAKKAASDAKDITLDGLNTIKQDFERGFDPNIQREINRQRRAQSANGSVNDNLPKKNPPPPRFKNQKFDID